MTQHDPKLVEQLAAALKAAGLNEDHDVRLAYGNAVVECFQRLGMLQAGWRPISEAPKDWTDLLLYPCPTKPVGVGFWNDDGHWCHGETMMEFEPTKFMPLPPPPPDTSRKE